jgi:hypothetical protein
LFLCLAGMEQYTLPSSGSSPFSHTPTILSVLVLCTIFLVSYLYLMNTALFSSISFISSPYFLLFLLAQQPLLCLPVPFCNSISLPPLYFSLYKLVRKWRVWFYLSILMA